MPISPARRLLVPVTAALALVATVLLVPTDAARAATQGIAGTVTISGGATVEGGQVEVIPVDPEVFLDGTEYYFDGGAFSISLPTGQYWLRFTAYGTEVSPAAEWWGDSPTKGGASAVTVTAGALTPTDVELALGGSITGHVAQDLMDSSAHDTKASLFMVDAGYPSGYRSIGWQYTDGVTGNYRFAGLATGDYKVYFHLRFSGREGWWQNATTRTAATVVPVTAPSTTSGVSPVNLGALGTITGKATRASSGAALAGVGVSIYSEYAPGSFSELDASTVTAADGTYTLKAPAGTYRVRFGAPSSALRTEFWNNAVTAAEGQDVAVTTSQATTGINIALDPTATVLTNTSRPTISGTRKVGATLTADEGRWEPLGPVLVGFRWLRNGTAIAGAVGRTYVPTAADAGKRLSLEVTAHKSGMTSAKATSAAVTIPYLVFKLTSAAALTGTLKVGRILRAVPPRCSPAASVRYQWLRNGIAIRGANRATYKLVRADKGKRAGVRITLVRTGYATVVKTVKKTAATR